jgi:endonuclease/exonuclease/phosphatase family metal-dependent hydrolase
MRQRILHILLLLVLPAASAFAQSLKVMTVNVWTGLDYVGKMSIGEYEPAAVRAQRMHILVKNLKILQPDIVALQEVNAASELGNAIADELGYDCIAMRTNAGAKLGSLGFPTNLNEGLVILSKRPLHLRFVDVWDLSEGLGVFGNLASMHWTERRLALVGKIRLGLADIFVANVHLSSVVPDDSSSRFVAHQIARARTADAQKCTAIVESYFEEAGNRTLSIKRILAQLNEVYAGKPWIVLGDFNAQKSQPEMKMLQQEGELLDAAELAGIGSAVTWDPERNSNIRYSVQSLDARGDTLSSYGLLSAWYDGKPRTIDHIFLNKFWRPSDIISGRIVLDKPENGLFASDHYGVMTTLDVKRLVQKMGVDPDGVPPTVEKQLEGLPILVYDSDTGFGFGAKGFLLNYLGWRESLDVLAFLSTKGERWYRAVFSIPDFELRQGRKFDLSFDLTIDYDKYLRNSFYGLGQLSKAADKETYTKQPLEILGVFSRGFSRELVAQVGIKYRTVRNYGYEPTSLFERSLPSINFERSSALTVCGAVRYDSRDSFVNPSRGQVAEIVGETGGSSLMGDYRISSLTYALQTYHVLFYPKTVFAARVWGQSVTGCALPLHVLSTVGGNRTLRGYSQDRFLDNAAMGVNGEIRFPIYWRIGGLLGMDAARVFPSFADATLSGWAYNPVVGMRLYMDTFVVRADLGFGKETTGFYLNFGQLF